MTVAYYNSPPGDYIAYRLVIPTSFAWSVNASGAVTNQATLSKSSASGATGGAFSPDDAYFGIPLSSFGNKVDFFKVSQSRSTGVSVDRITTTSTFSSFKAWVAWHPSEYVAVIPGETSVYLEAAVITDSAVTKISPDPFSAQPGTNQFCAGFNPTGTLLAVGGNWNGTACLHLYTVSGSGASMTFTDVTATNIDAQPYNGSGSPDIQRNGMMWSPDGTKLAVIGNHGVTNYASVYDVSGSSLVMNTADLGPGALFSFTSRYSVAWSNDSRYVYFTPSGGGSIKGYDSASSYAAVSPIGITPGAGTGSWMSLDTTTGHLFLSTTGGTSYQILAVASDGTLSSFATGTMTSDTNTSAMAVSHKTVTSE